MSFIEEKLAKRADIKNMYTLNKLEDIIAEQIINDAKVKIGEAIDHSQNYVSRYYAYDYETGCYLSYMAQNDPDQHLKSFGGSLPDFTTLICPNYEKDPQKLAIKKAVELNQSNLNLMRIEQLVRQGFLNLGAKRVVVYVRCPKTKTVKVLKRGFFQNYYVEETHSIPEKKYLICYSISW